MKRVLIALDYDITAQKVAETGFSIGRSMDAEIFILHVMEDNTYYSILNYPSLKGYMGFSGSEADHLFDAGPKKAMESYLNKTKQFLGDESIQIILKEGEFAETIIKYANDLQVNYIVMGSRCPIWLKNIVVGNVTESVLKDTSIPVLVVPGKDHH